MDSINPYSNINTNVDINQPSYSYGNPWSGLANQAYGSYNNAMNAYMNQAPQLQNQMGQQAQQYMQLGQQADQQYPTFPNNAGIGSGVPFGGQQQNNAPNTDPLARIGVYELKGQALTR